MSARLGVTLGAGSSGVGGSYLAAADVWPAWWAGVGVEGVRGGSTRIGLFVPDDHDTFSAGRLRLSLRAVRAHGIEFGGAVGLGVASASVHDEEEIPASECYDYETDRDLCDSGWFNPAVSTRVESGTYFALSLELGLRAHFGHAEVGAVARVDVCGPVVLASFGPTLGFAF